MNTPKVVSDYMRQMQRRSAASRWSGLSAAEKSAAMKALRAKAKRKPKASSRRQNLPNCPACLQPLSLSEITTTIGKTDKTDRLVSCRNRDCANTSAQSGLFVRPEEEPADAAVVLVRIVSARMKRSEP